MSASDGTGAELETLFAALEAGQLDAAGRQRLNELLREDPEALEALGNQLEIEAMLRWHHGQAAGLAPPADRLRSLGLWLGIAAGLLIALGLYLYTRVDPITPRPVQSIRLANWQLDAQSGAQYQVISPRRVRLTVGELRLRATQSTSEPLEVVTPEGLTRARGTEFLIGSHPGVDTPPQPEREAEMSKSLTRVLVLSGTVSLSNNLGAVEGASHDLLVAPQGEVPYRHAAAASNAFGMDLYKALAQRRGDENLFLSPYSINLALTMCAEGARGQTAAEFGKVLRWPAVARRRGEQGQQLPFVTSLLHSGHKQLQFLFADRGQDPKQLQMKQEIAQLKARCAAIGKQIEADRKGTGPGMTVAEQAELRRELRKLEGRQRLLLRALLDYELHLANALFAEQSYPFDPAYVRTIDAAYGTGNLRNLDFARDPAGAAKQINAWVNEQTRGHITDLVDPERMKAGLKLMLLNTVYMRAGWTEPFSQRNTRPQPFTLLDGSQVRVPMMAGYGHGASRYAAFDSAGNPFKTPEMYDPKQDGEDRLYPKDGLQVLELFYRGGELSMLILLPRRADGLRGLERRLDAGSLELWVDHLEERATNVRMPRFESENELGLVEVLEQLGLRAAFDRAADGADFSGMSLSRRAADRLYISDVRHRAKLLVNERGSEAVAATVIEMPATGAAIRREQPFVPTVAARHPFVYLIRHRQSGTVLFMGRCTDPR